MRRADLRRTLLGAAAVVAVSAGVAAVTPTSRASGSAFRSQAAAGASIYRQNCLSCHGPHGAGVPGVNEPTEGVRFQQRNPTALVIFDVVRSGREPSLRALTDDQIWAAIAAELAANGVDLGDTVLGPATAAAAVTAPAGHADRAHFFPPGR